MHPRSEQLESVDRPSVACDPSHQLPATLHRGTVLLDREREARLGDIRWHWGKACRPQQLSETHWVLSLEVYLALG
jgi:hypothetical protein